MELNRKKIVIIAYNALVEAPENGDVTDFHIRKDVLDKLCAMKSVTRLIITHALDEKAYIAQLKAIELFVFVYCKIAVSTSHFDSELMNTLPHSLRRKDLMVAVGDREAAEELEIDYVECLQ